MGGIGPLGIAGAPGAAGHLGKPQSIVRTMHGSIASVGITPTRLGSLARVRLSQALASTIQAMLALTPEERADMRQQAHQEYRARFTANAMADHYMDEYRQLLGGTVLPNRALRAA